MTLPARADILTNDTVAVAVGLIPVAGAGAVPGVGFGARTE